MILISLIVGLLLLYLLLTLISFYIVHQMPRNPVTDPPDWGTVTDTEIIAIDGGKLEVWRVEPEGESRGIVLLAHGWGRNRDRMVNRARLFGKMNFTTVMHSARDHGNSSPKKMMNGLRFAEDIETVLNWVGQPVILYGHSMGSMGAIITASRNPSTVGRLIMEASFPNTGQALRNLYRWVNPVFGILMGPMIVFWMNLFYPNFNKIHPARLAPQIRVPVLIVHGENDNRFPASYAPRLQEAFRPGQADLFIAKGAGHSDASLKDGYDDAVRSFLNRQEST